MLPKLDWPHPRWEPGEVRAYPLVALALPTLQEEVYLEVHILNPTQD